MAKKIKYLEKEVSFGGGSVLLFSLDGCTWSSKKEELEGIMERYEQQKLNFGEQILRGAQAKSSSSENTEKSADSKKTGSSDSIDVKESDSDKVDREASSDKGKTKEKKTTKKATTTKKKA